MLCRVELVCSEFYWDWVDHGDFVLDSDYARGRCVVIFYYLSVAVLHLVLNEGICLDMI